MRKTPKVSNQLTELLASKEPKVKALYVGTYIPRECGIATFTKDLTNAINLLNPNYLADIIAIDDVDLGGEKKNYPWEVKYKIRQGELRSWLDAADYINDSGAEVVSIQHEFGIYGSPGTYGESAVQFMEAIKKPIVVTFHTVLPNPNEQQLNIVKRICKRADAIVVMVNIAVKWLVDSYDVDGDKIVVIPHGVPDIPFTPSAGPKVELELGKDNIIMGFGLISSGKGYEQAVGAMPKILKKHPNTKLVILGQTHPVVRRHEGEKYRNSLKKLAKDLGVENAIKYVNRYLSLDEIVDYLKATDIYITPFYNLDQITSGTLSYAVGAGRACISSPYLYAQEVLDEGRGTLVEPGDPEMFAKEVINLLDHPRTRLKIAKKAYDYGRNMIWPSVALKYLDLFKIVTHQKDDCLTDKS